jgi:hypothetical protein
LKLASRQTLETKNLPRKPSNKKVTEEIHAENLNFKNTRSRGVHGSNASFDQAPPHRDLPRKREESRKIKEGKTEKITTMEEEIGAAPPLGEMEGDRGHTSPGNKKTYIPRPSIQTAGNKAPERMFGNNGEENKVDAGRNMDGQRRPFSAVAVPANGTTIRDEDLTKAFASIDQATREELIQKLISLKARPKRGEKGTGKECSLDKSLPTGRMQKENNTSAQKGERRSGGHPGQGRKGSPRASRYTQRRKDSRRAGKWKQESKEKSGGGKNGKKRPIPGRISKCR